MSDSCFVCQISADSIKYKCPTCFIKYCSLDCWKEHKKVECKSQEDEISIDKVGALRSLLFPTDDTIFPADLIKLKENKKLVELLKNPALCAVLADVEKASNVNAAMKNAMQEPIFVEFADICLNIYEPDGRSDVDRNIINAIKSELGEV